MLDARAEPRRDLEVDVEVPAVLLGNPDIRLRCQLVEVSQSGVRLLISSRISLDCVIKIQWGGHFLVGRPRYVKPTPKGYLVGLRLHGCSQWLGKA
jgi:hypothetical protein